MTDKRKAAADPDDGDTRNKKKAKTATDQAEVKDLGLKFIANLRAARDKTGRHISTVFEQLPDAKEFPDYYDEIKLPISLETIEEKLNKDAYPTLIAVESDFKRLVQNAKHYNDKHSAIYQDAERVRKTASNWMTKNNPAYKDPNYVATPTPLPGEETNGSSTPVVKVQAPKTPAPKAAAAAAAAATPTAPISTSASSRTRRGTMTNSTPQSKAKPEPKPAAKPAAKPAPPPTPPEPTPVEEEDETWREYVGLTWQQAQEKIMNDLINYTEEDIQIYEPFKFLPSRSLVDYYQIIKNPVSLNAVQKKVRGISTRGPATGISEYKSWDEMLHDMTFIWENAWTYNEDGSDISQLAHDLKDEFERVVNAAKKAGVQEPSKPTLKINMSQPKPSGLKLRFGGPKASPAPSSAPDTPAGRSSTTPGFIVDKEALERQQAHVQAGVNGGRPPSAGTPTMGRTPSATNINGSRSIPPGTSPAPNGIKKEASQDSRLAQAGIGGVAPHSMAPPHLQQRPASGSPHPYSPYAQPGHHPQQQPPPPPTYIPAPSIPQQFPSKRNPNVPSILPEITISTHPALLHPPKPTVSNPWKLTVTPSPTSNNNSVVVSLPASHSALRVEPRIPHATSHPQKPWRLWVTVNGLKVAQTMRPPTAGDAAKDRPCYDVRLPIPVVGGGLQAASVSRIDVEVLAAVSAPPASSDKENENTGSTEDGQKEDTVIRETCTIFVHLLKALS